MIQIFNANFNQQTYSPLKRNKTVYKTSVFKNDTFESSRNISFRGLEKLFVISPDFSKPIPQIEVLSGVSNDFASKVTKQVHKFPIRWLQKFKDNNYKIILSPTFSDAYKSQKVFDPSVEMFERQNPKGTLGVTYSEGKSGKNFFVFCDKPPYSNIFMPSIVNHELSHGVVNIKELDKNSKTLELIKKDVGLIIQERKLDELTPAERKMVSHYFFNNNAYLPIDEIIADMYAWNQGVGCYGSGLVMNVQNPNLMKNLFPNLSRYLKTI